MTDPNAQRIARATTLEVDQARYCLERAMAWMKKATWLSPGAENACQDAMGDLDQAIAGIGHAIAADAEHMREKGI